MAQPGKSNRAKIFLTIAVLIVIINAAVALRAVNVLVQHEGWVSHTLEVLGDIQELSASVATASSATRGFLLTQNEDFSNRFESFASATRSQIKRIREVTGDNPVQQKNLDELSDLLEHYLATQAEAISVRKQKGLAAATDLLLAEHTQRFTEPVRTAIQHVKDEENRLLAERDRQSQHSLFETIASISLATLLDVVLLAFMFRYANQQLALRAVAERSVEQMQTVQSLSDVALMHLSSTELTDEMLDKALAAFKADYAAILRQSAETHSYSEIAAKGMAMGDKELAASTALLDSVTESGSAISVAELNADNQAPSGPLKSAMLAPLRTSDSTREVLIVAYRARVQVSDEDQMLLQLFADRVALALERAALFNAEKDARRDAEHSADEVRRLNEELESRVQQRTAELEAANKELEAFSYSVSHDLRAPLRTVDGFSQALEEDYAATLGSDGKDFIRRIRGGVQRMGGLIDDLLQLSRVTRSDLDVQSFDLSEVAQTVALDLENVARQEHRSVQFRIQPDIIVRGDARLLRVALENLLGNAYKFTSKREQAVIEVAADDASVFVRDNGVGFDMQYVGKLFNAFQRLHGDKDFKGSGIGLATVQRVIRRHGGKVWAEAELGQGATVHFTLS